MPFATLEDALEYLLHGEIESVEQFREALETVADRRGEFSAGCLEFAILFDDPDWDKLKAVSDPVPDCFCGHHYMIHGITCQCPWRSET